MSFATIEPTVIDEELIRRAINEQLNPEIAEIAKKEGVDPEEVLSLRLDYKNILKIDNLWIYENITKLQLDNNIIEKIENVNFLKNLKWLDLSFNNITEIEGLGSLTKLTDLTLFNNRISKIGNMDDLVSLQLAYLIRFENLRVLNMTGNPVHKNPNYKNYCLAHFKNLKYLDYRLIDQESIAIAREKHIDSIISQEEEEKINAKRKQELNQKQELDKLHQKAHILKIDSLFDRMFDEDQDYKRLLPIAPAILSDMKEEYRAKFEIVVKEFKHFVLKKSQEKQDETNAILSCLDGVKSTSDKECLNKLELFHHQKKQLIKIVQVSRNPKEIDDTIKELRDLTVNLSDYLMNAEMIIVEQFEDVLKDFERSYTELCNSIGECGQSSFARLRDLENEYLEKFTENIQAMYERFNKGDAEEVDDEIRDIMSDKDVLMNAVNSSHDFRMFKLDQQEDGLVTGLAKDLESIVKDMYAKEIKRNRDRVSEILALLDKTNAEIDFAEENSY
ncbi:Dynein regulatory complex subunit 3 [Boothiomyces macroporosus]|uniref:Dynein regulatory complex subunit 3 n=1 Tax=Boothiomyces macroporosus TaxID=261099 RepID=A0AAD5UN25_9FUNG|nr:Dynein regulatory complex subunit 3 [Boothiomyces macroporosus]